MKNAFKSLFNVLVTTGALIMALPIKAESTNNVPKLVQGNNTFAFDLYSRVNAGKENENLCFSPYSISTCLAMTYAGARGETELQMAKALHFTTNQAQLHAGFATLQKQLNEAEKQQGIKLNVANALWAQQGHPFLPAFLQIAQQNYDARVNQVDFRTQSESARKEINDWVSKKTNGKIEEIIPSGALDAMTKLVLVNAIYFKGQWATQFNKSRTAPADFSISSSQKVQAQLMNLKSRFKFADRGNFQLLEMPYKGNELSMVVLLPKEVEGTQKLESMLHPKELSDWLSQAASPEVNVFLPKFKINAGFELGQPLAAMGMTDAFTAKADFSGMDGTRDLFISSVIHKAFVEVNEEGTEAAAATGITMSRTAAVHAPPTFRADHPFLFLIRDMKSGSILFMGRVTDPTK
ncbi:serpin family protein [Pedosphaera parvula]|nr:serpin family protein [Pedosphaera parvula]